MKRSDVLILVAVSALVIIVTAHFILDVPFGSGGEARDVAKSNHQIMQKVEQSIELDRRWRNELRTADQIWRGEINKRLDHIERLLVDARKPKSGS